MPHEPDKDAASKGGQARAKAMTAEERTLSARRAAEARWGHTVLDATHAGQIVVGDRSIDCAVLEDETRVLSQSTVLVALGRVPDKSRRGSGRNPTGDKRAPFLSAANLQPYVSPEVRRLDQPVVYRLPGSGNRMVGYDARILPRVCAIYDDASHDGVLVPKQHATAQAARILLRGLAETGIVGLVDEATGYQDVRARDALQKILETYVTAEFRKWVSTFPDEFFEQIYRLQGWTYHPESAKRTPYVGKLINQYIYDQLPPGVREELTVKNPRNEKGNRSRKHHQHLTADTGLPHLDKQIATVTTLMRIAHNKPDFEDMFERAFPPPQLRLPLVIEVKPEDS